MAVEVEGAEREEEVEVEVEVDMVVREWRRMASETESGRLWRR